MMVVSIGAPLEPGELVDGAGPAVERHLERPG
jgi:hypothetical protein